MRVYLADKSAWEQTRYSEKAADRLLDVRAKGRLAICAVVEAELLYSARDPVDFLARRADYDELLWLDTMPQAQQRVIDIMQTLAMRGQHRSVGIADLLIAATAEATGATVLHYDSDYERIAEITGQPHEWIVPRGEGHGRSE